MMYKVQDLLLSEEDQHLLLSGISLNVNGYARCYKEGRQFALHKYILEEKIGRKLRPGECADHANRNRLDCRRENLRVATRAQNSANVSKRANASSRFKGVYFDKRKKLWSSRIAFANKQMRLGYYSSEEEAANMYDQFAIQIHGEFSAPNFDYQ